MARSVTLKGNPLSLEGPELKAGDSAPDARVKKSLVESIKISETPARTRIFSVVPSLDTPVCAEQTKKFNEAAADLADVEFYTISCDLPTAQARFCGAANINTERLRVLSDHAETSFGKAYGTLVPDLRVLCRAVFVVDAAGKIQYAEYVPEIAEQPNYDAVLACAKKLTGG